MPNKQTGPLETPPAYVLNIFELKRRGLTGGQIAIKTGYSPSKVHTAIRYWRDRIKEN